MQTDAFRRCRGSWDQCDSYALPRFFPKSKSELKIKMKPCLFTTAISGRLSTLVVTLLLGVNVQAAPSLDVRKPPVISGANPNTGPSPIDPTAKQGQWFIGVSSTSSPQVRRQEFHDNVPGQGGG